MKVEGRQKEGRKGGWKGLKSPQRMNCLHNRESYDFELRANIHLIGTLRTQKRKLSRTRLSTFLRKGQPVL